MRGVTLLLVHGWGFDAALWDGLRDRLGGWPSLVAERGYFGPATAPLPDGPVVAIGHSLGALLLLLAPPSGLRALVAINGFDRFGGSEGVPPRVIGRMIGRFADAPREVLAEFRARCGEDAPFGTIDAARLAADLALLRDGDARGPFAAPLLALDGDADPILPPALRATSFGGAPLLRREACVGGGHLLPATSPDWCATHIRALLAELA